MRTTAIGKTLVLTALVLSATAAPGQAGSDADRGVPEVVRLRHASRAPATVQVQVRVPPRRENRALRVSLDSESYFRSSEVALEGTDAALMQSVRWPGVPAGTYAVVVELIRSDGKHQVVRGGTLRVIGFGGN